MSNQVDDTALAATFATTNPRTTIRPGSLDATISVGGEDGVVGAANLDALAPRLVVGSTIGQGGMAVVRSATQTALRREVAVKSLRDTETSSQASSRLLREAWITGALEHPNIVPVHDLGSDERGRPMIVLKRIEGRPWSELLGHTAEIRARFGMDPLEWNLQQLVHVCHAVAFAHSRKILHRDLKPANIMIGGFGEVYVLDWGIAVSLVDDGSGRLPLASECRDIAGTLAYMAPEMLGDATLSERTDVYLLGAILFEIVAGGPPHLCDSVQAMLASIASSEPRFPPDAPEELAAICRRALAADPAARYPSADELRIAILGFLEHRGSAEISRESQQRLRELEVHLKPPQSEDAASRVTTYQLFGQCRFGFQAALRAWPENVSARAGLDLALVAMATYELDHDDARAAAVLLSELATPVPELATRLTRVEAHAAEKAHRLARIEADQDASRGSVIRTIFLTLFGLSWATIPLFAGLLPIVAVNHATAILVTGLSVVAVIVFAVVARDAMTKTTQNRGVLLTVLLGLVLHGLVEVAAWIMGLDMATTQMISIGLWAGACGIAAVFLDRALLVPTLGFIVAVVATIQSPEHRFWAISASCTVLLTMVVYIWHQARHGRPIAGLADLLRPKL